VRAALIQPIRLRTADGAEVGRKVTWLELFFDLAFVAAVAEVGSPLTADYSVAGLLRYALLFFLIWWAWLGHALYATRFDTDDLVQRLLTLAQIFGVAVMAVNADDALDSRSSAGFAAAYAALRVILVLQYLRARRVARARAFATRSAIGVGAAAALWLLSSVTPVPLRFWMWGVALAIDLATPLVTAAYTTQVPPDTNHLPERFGLFTIIVIGETLVSVMKGMKTQESWTAAAASSAILGIAVTSTIWWWYVDGAEAAGELHLRGRRATRRLHVWAYTHLLLYLGLAVAGVGVEHVIQFAPVGHLSATEAWLLSGALATTMAAVATIAVARPAPGPATLGKSTAVSHYAVAAGTLLIGAANALVPPAPFLLALAVLCLMQLLISLRAPRASIEAAATATRGWDRQTSDRARF
jgi:low temperature requirement protein LtrA